MLNSLLYKNKKTNNSMNSDYRQLAEYFIESACEQGPNVIFSVLSYDHTFYDR